MKRIFYTLLLSTALIVPASGAMAQMIEKTDEGTVLAAATTETGGVAVTSEAVMSGQNLGAASVKQIQQSLSDRGYYKGSINGKWDDTTTKALASFQKASGESGPQDGMLIKSSTLAKLNVMLKPTPEETTPASRVSKDTSKEAVTTGLAGSSMTNPGKTVLAPDNGSKSTMTRNAVSSGQFNSTIDGSAAAGSTGVASQRGTTTGSSSSSVAADTGASLNATTPAGGSVGTTGTLSGTDSPAPTGILSGSGTASNNVDGRPGPGSPPTSSSALGGRASGSASSSGSLSGGSGGSSGGGGGGGL